jgi:hypothetical protein
MVSKTMKSNTMAVVRKVKNVLSGRNHTPQSTRPERAKSLKIGHCPITRAMNTTNLEMVE